MEDQSKSKPVMIEAVPAHLAQETPIHQEAIAPLIEVPQWAVVRAALSETAIGSVVGPPQEAFKGDPSRVLGHPSNPTTAIFRNR